MKVDNDGKSILTGLTSMEEATATAWLEDKVTNDDPDAQCAGHVLKILNALNGVVKTLLHNNG